MALASPRLPSTRIISSSIITALGISLGLYYLYYSLTWTHSILRLIEPILLLTLSTVIGYAGYWLYRCDYTHYWVSRIAVWSLAGFFGTLLLAYWILIQQLAQGTSLHNPLYVGLNIGTIGATVGLLIGLQEGRANRRAKIAQRADATANRARSQIAFVNRLLRHHVLNGMNIIHGYANRLITESNGAPPDELARIQARSDAIVDIIKNVEVLGQTYTNEIDSKPTDIGEILDTAIDTIDLLNAQTTINADYPTNCYVAGGPPLVTVFSNLLDTLNKRATTPNPSITITADIAKKAIVIQITAPDVTITPDEYEDIFDPGEHGDRHLEMYLVESIVTSYGGDIWIEQADAGVRFSIMLERVNPKTETSNNQ